MKIIFAGTTDFAIPTLEKLLEQHELSLIITPTDKPVGRKKVLTAPAIKIWAEKNNLPVQQTEKISNLKSLISNLEPDLLLVAAFGQIIPSDVLNIPKFGSINIHASMLPKYRGASPIQTAIVNGDKETGISLIKMDEKPDHGPILGKKLTTITIDDNYQTLYNKLALLTADITPEVLRKYFTGQIAIQEQDHSKATLTKQFIRADGKINWGQPAQQILQQLKALNPEPGTWTKLNEKSINILQATLSPTSKIELPGKIYREGRNLMVKTQDFSLRIDRLKPEGKNEMAGSDFLNGLKNLTSLFFN